MKNVDGRTGACFKRKVKSWTGRRSRWIQLQAEKSCEELGVSSGKRELGGSSRAGGQFRKMDIPRAGEELAGKELGVRRSWGSVPAKKELGVSSGKWRAGGQFRQKSWGSVPESWGSGELGVSSGKGELGVSSGKRKSWGSVPANGYPESWRVSCELGVRSLGVSSGQ
jgi:hypothetical protein